MADHREVNRREFARQAAGFEREGYLLSDAGILDWIAAHVPVAPGDAVLDVAGGTGQLGRRLARDAGWALVVDLTPEMLRMGAAAAAARSAPNVTFVEGDATRLPFVDGQFDVVACRFAFHHLDDPGAACREMARACRPGGLVAVIDMVSAPGEDGRAHNAIERLRDPSHSRALEADELVGLLRDADVAADVVASRRNCTEAEPWIAQAAPPEHAAQEIRAALEAELSGDGPPTGLIPVRDDAGRVAVQQDWVVVAGAAG